MSNNLMKLFCFVQRYERYIGYNFCNSVKYSCAEDDPMATRHFPLIYDTMCNRYTHAVGFSSLHFREEDNP